MWSRSKFCDDCVKIRLKESYEHHKKIARKNSKLFYYKNKDNPSFKYERNEKYKIYHKKRSEEDNNFAVSNRLRNLLYQALQKYTKSGKSFTSEKYGINFNNIMKSLEPFPKNLRGWHIDHIKPLSSFNLEDPYETKKAFSPKNHQWLRASENIKKGNKISNDFS